ncbi:ervatamin-B-like protein [Carex littledalei]|uniref:Ervatamin-B-like protein n=1 Tax=Carex littledalei TaxID=544730 RepID=A0A833VKD6_9POAL|nr:ervatamin-B-like protein [Carex littledalei]
MPCRMSPYVEAGCGAYAVVAALDGLNKIETGRADRLRLWGSCYGGTMDDAYEWVMKNGITTSTDYPYNSTRICNIAKTMHHQVTTTGYVHVTPYNESALMNAIAIQPVSVAIQASGSSFQFYMGDSEELMGHILGPVRVWIYEDEQRHYQHSCRHK